MATTSGSSTTKRALPDADVNYKLKDVDPHVQAVMQATFGKALMPESPDFRRDDLQRFVGVCPFCPGYYDRLSKSKGDKDAFAALHLALSGDVLIEGEDYKPRKFCKSGAKERYWDEMFQHCSDLAGMCGDSDDDSGDDFGPTHCHANMLKHMQNILGRNTHCDIGKRKQHYSASSKRARLA